MTKVGRPGMVLVILRIQVALSLLLLVATMMGGSFLLTFSQLPGGLLDAAGADDGALYAILFHVIYTLGLVAFMAALQYDFLPEPAIAVQALAAILAFPFGAVLAHQSWKLTRAGAWDEAFHDAGRVGRAAQFRIGILWGLVAVASGFMALLAYVGVLSGAPLPGLLALLAAVAIQWAGLQAIFMLQRKTALKTFGSPMPELPDA